MGGRFFDGTPESGDDILHPTGRQWRRSDLVSPPGPGSGDVALVLGNDREGQSNFQGQIYRRGLDERLRCQLAEGGYPWNTRAGDDGGQGGQMRPIESGEAPEQL